MSTTRKLAHLLTQADILAHEAHVRYMAKRRETKDTYRIVYVDFAETTPEQRDELRAAGLEVREMRKK